MAVAANPITIFIAAGGTGGHLFPARYIGQALLERNKNFRVEFIGTGRDLESRIIDSAGFRRHVIASTGVKGKGATGFLGFLKTLPQAIRETRELFDALEPSLVIGVGGYVTVVPVMVAFFRKIPTLIHEAEIRPGLANKFLAFFAKRITVSFNEATIRPKRKVVVTGQPVRPEMKRFLEAPLHLPPHPHNLLVLGGSLGAKGIDDGLMELAPYIAQRGLKVMHQTRPENSSRVVEVYQRANVHGMVVNFIDNMDQAYANADIIIARAGASTIMEIAIVNRPTIFVPYPSAQGDHQTNNARVLEAQGKAMIVPQGEAFAQRLRAAIEAFLVIRNYEKTVKLPCAQRNIDGAQRIAAAGLSLISVEK